MELLSPATPRAASVFLSPFSPESIGRQFIGAAGGGVPASAVYQTAQRAFYFPFRLARTETVYRFFWANGTTAGTDNIQVGVYDAVGNSIKLGTSTLAAGTSAVQFDNIADTTLRQGRYYMALWSSGVTTHILRTTTSQNGMYRLAGATAQSSLASGLPTTATFASSSVAYIPLFGLALRATP